jgi:hypothetical protein
MKKEKYTFDIESYDFTYAELYNNAVMKINNWADICHNTDPIKEVDDSSNSYDKRLLLM